MTNSVANRADVAMACNLTPRRVNQLAAEGILPRLGHGAYDLLACVVAYIRFLHQCLRKEPTPRARMLAIRVARKELALRQALSQVISVTDHQADLAHLVRTTLAVFGTVGRRAAPEVIALGSGASRAAIEAAIDKCQRVAMAELATLLWQTMPSCRRRRRPRKSAPVMRLERGFATIRESSGAVVDTELPAHSVMVAA